MSSIVEKVDRASLDRNRKCLSMVLFLSSLKNKTKTLLWCLNPFLMHCVDSCTSFCWSRASDKKRNLAQQKAEAQRRLYGHGSMKKLSAASSDWEKQRHTLERRREELVRHKQINKLLHLVQALFFTRKRFTEKDSAAGHWPTAVEHMGCLTPIQCAPLWLYSHEPCS